MQKRTIIKRIKGIIDRFGEFTPVDLNEDSPIVHSNGSTCEMVKWFSNNHVLVRKYDGHVEVDCYNVSYEDLSKDVLEEVLFLAELFETDSLKTEKRMA